VNRLAWPKLMRLGLQELGLRPEVFWSLTPAEFLLLTGFEEEGSSLGRAGFEEMMTRYPDIGAVRSNVE
jgi:uncharacterized phage protein (TIGR02216 family)